MKSINFYSLFSLIFVFLAMGCTKKDSVDPLSELYIYGTYTNYNLQTPKFVIDKSNTPSSVTTGTPVVGEETTTQGVRMKIRIPGVQITLGEKNYALESFTVEEKKTDGWKKQEEFSALNNNTVNKIAAVLVLDMSSSLGQDVSRVKSEAIQFANNFFNQNLGSLGLILFSETITEYSFSTNITTFTNNINNYTTYRDATTLYGAMQRGLNLLNNYTGSSVDKKVLITFTDGGDNNTNSPTSVKNSIINNTAADKYVIGLKGKGGDFSETDLKSLVTKSNYYVPADDATKLNSAFTNIFQSLTTTSAIDYYRTTQKFTINSDNPIEIRLKLVVKK